jgi:DNA-binding MarR family transcriptional regulator
MSQKSNVVVPDNDIDLWLLLGNTWTIILRLYELELGQMGLTPEQATILRIIQDNGNATTARELEKVTMRQQNTISILTNRMIKMGLLTRVKKPGKKGYEIFLTKEGKSQLKRVKMKAIDMTFSSLTEEEKLQLVRCLFPLYKKARSLLVVAHVPPFLQLISDGSESRMKNPEEDLSNKKVWTLLDRTGFGIFRLLELEVTTLGLTMGQMRVLRILSDNGGTATYKNLESVTTRQRHSISTLINRMVKIDLVNNQKSPTGRWYTVSFTKKGEEMLHRIPMLAIENTISTLSENQKSQLTILLNTLNAKARGLLGK